MTGIPLLVVFCLAIIIMIVAISKFNVHPFLSLMGVSLLELIAPKGFKYMSIGSSLSRNNRMGINYGFYITRDFIGESYNDPPKMQAIPSGTGKAVDMQQLQNYMDAVHSISWWRPKYGPVLDESLLEGRE